MSKQKHLTLDSRIIIETKLNERESFKSIGRFLNKDCTTISKEVKNHIFSTKPEPTEKLSMIVSLLSNGSAQIRTYAINALLSKLVSAGPVVNTLLPAFFTKNTCAPSFQKRLTSVTVVRIAINAPWKNTSTVLPTPRKNTNWSGANPDPALQSLRQN